LPVIASNLVIERRIIIALTHAAIYDYRLGPGDIIYIIALTHAQFMIFIADLVISILLSPDTRRNL
jgi:hypothetical protein